MLQSITLQYDAVEDRLLLRLIEKAQEQEPAREQCLLLTRRICRGLGALLQRLAETSAQAPERLPQPVRASMVAGHHEAMSAQVPLRRSAPDQMPPTPSSQALVLAVDGGRRRSTNAWVLRFELRDAPALQLTLTEQTLHALIGLLDRRIEAAQWGLPPVVKVIRDEEVDPAQSQRSLH